MKLESKLFLKLIGGGLGLSMVATAGSGSAGGQHDTKPPSEGGKADNGSSNGSSNNKRVALSGGTAGAGGSRRHRSSLGSSRIRQSHSLNRYFFEGKIHIHTTSTTL